MTAGLIIFGAAFVAGLALGVAVIGTALHRRACRKCPAVLPGDKP